jgi:hypothetical protein
MTNKVSDKAVILPVGNHDYGECKGRSLRVFKLAYLLGSKENREMGGRVGAAAGAGADLCGCGGGGGRGFEGFLRYL